MLTTFTSGAIFLGYLAAALFFFRFWKKTRDRLFVMFSISFFVLGMERIVPLFVSITNEHQLYIYGTRLVAFLLLIFAILDKNRRN
jgi:amino acid transporter